jgi:hypothetical protein
LGGPTERSELGVSFSNFKRDAWAHRDQKLWFNARRDFEHKKNICSFIRLNSIYNPKLIFCASWPAHAGPAHIRLSKLSPST